jgi:hypothetical protein
MNPPWELEANGSEQEAIEVAEAVRVLLLGGGRSRWLAPATMTRGGV